MSKTLTLAFISSTHPRLHLRPPLYHNLSIFGGSQDQAAFDERLLLSRIFPPCKFTQVILPDLLYILVSASRFILVKKRWVPAPAVSGIDARCFWCQARRKRQGKGCKESMWEQSTRLSSEKSHLNSCMYKYIREPRAYAMCECCSFSTSVL